MKYVSEECRRIEREVATKALEEAGIEATIRHGTGNAWGWLEVNVGPDASDEEQQKAERVTRIATGRTYDQILIVAQSGPGFHKTVSVLAHLRRVGFPRKERYGLARR